jgi:hypothetical protein
MRGRGCAAAPRRPCSSPSAIIDSVRTWLRFRRKATNASPGVGFIEPRRKTGPSQIGSASGGPPNERQWDVPRARKEFNEKAAAQPHVRPVQPLRFGDEPSEAERTVTQSHLRRALDEVLHSAVRLTTSTVGSGRPVYYRANDVRCLVPDGFVRHGIADHPFTVWKTWERGAPQIAFEIVSLDKGALEEKIVRYHELGVRELVVFDLDAPAGRRLRVWDRIDGDFVERIIEGEQTLSLTLEYDLAVGPILIAGVRYDACVRLLAPRERYSQSKEDEMPFIPTEEEAQDIADRAEHARELEQQAILSEAQSQRAAALARGNARAAQITSSNDRRLAELKRPK